MKLTKTQKGWKIGDKYKMYPIGVDFVVEGIIKTEEQLEQVELFSELHVKIK